MSNRQEKDLQTCPLRYKDRVQCEHETNMQLPLAGLVENPNQLQNKPRPVPTVRWVDDRKEYDRQYYLLNRQAIIARSVKWKRDNKEKANAWTRKWKRAHRELMAKRMRDYRARKPDKASAANKRSYARHAEKRRANRIAKRDAVKENALAKVWRKRNWKTILAKKRLRHKTDVRYAIETRLRGQLVKAVSRARTQKVQPAFKLLGCSLSDFLKYLESKFTEGMTWENRSLWQIDHIRPVALYDLTDPEQQRACFHWSNLQPLWAIDNRKKQDTWPLPQNYGRLQACVGSVSGG